MIRENNHKLSQHKDAEIPYHLEWGLSRDAVLWADNRPVALNFYPIATEFRSWLLREGHFSIITKLEENSSNTPTNPYSSNASTIAAILARVINANHRFANSEEKIDQVDAEIERIRLYNEQVLYTARICEVTIKQLLHCTLIPKKLYKNASLGGLLSIDCKPCRDSGKPHKISLLGSLAHRYHLCLPFEKCLIEHLKIVNRRRNTEAAHSDAQILNIRTDDESRSQSMSESVEIGNELVHMLEHISDLEQKMIRELETLNLTPYSKWQ